MKVREAYTVEAARRFLEGLPHAAPHEAVESGARTVREWCCVLAAVRAERGVTAVSRPVVLAADDEGEAA